MSAAFDDSEIHIPRGSIESSAELMGKLFVHLLGGLEVAPRECAIDGDRTHAGNRSVDLEDSFYENGVFVDELTVNFDKALADWFNESDFSVLVLQSREEAEACRGFTFVHSCPRDEDTFCLGVGGVGQ